MNVCVCMCVGATVCVSAQNVITPIFLYTHVALMYVSLFISAPKWFYTCNPKQFFYTQLGLYI